MMNFQNLHEARIHVQEMSEEATAEIGDQEVFEYSTGEVEILDGIDGETISDPQTPSKYLGTVAQVLY